MGFQWAFKSVRWWAPPDRIRQSVPSTQTGHGKSAVAQCGTSRWLKVSNQYGSNKRKFKTQSQPQNTKVIVFCSLIVLVLFICHFSTPSPIIYVYTAIHIAVTYYLARLEREWRQGRQLLLTIETEILKEFSSRRVILAQCHVLNWDTVIQPPFRSAAWLLVDAISTSDHYLLSEVYYWSGDITPIPGRRSELCQWSSGDLLTFVTDIPHKLVFVTVSDICLSLGSCCVNNKH